MIQSPDAEMLSSGILPYLRRKLRGKQALPGIIEFAEDPKFLGLPPLFPRQRILLQLIYLQLPVISQAVAILTGWLDGFFGGARRWGMPPDTLERVKWLKSRGRSHFAWVLLIMGRRAGKGHICAIVVLYETYRLLLLDDPQAHYGIAPGKPIHALCVATTLKQARDNVYADVSSFIRAAPCFRPHLVDVASRKIRLMTEADKRRLAASSMTQDAAARRVHASIEIEAVAANPNAVRGYAVYALVFDEYCFAPDADAVDSSYELYSALVPSLMQFHGDAIALVPSSPKSTEGKAYELYEAALEEENGKAAHPDFLVVQLPSWDLYLDTEVVELTGGHAYPPPIMTNDTEELDRTRRLDPDFFEREYESQFPAYAGTYLSREAVDRIFLPFCSSCGEASVESPCPECGNSLATLGPQQRGRSTFEYWCHIDIGYSQSNLAAVIAHREAFEGADGEPVDHVVVDWVACRKANEFSTGRINFDESLDEIVQMIGRFPTLRKVSFDQYGASATVSGLTKRLNRIRHKARVNEINQNALLNLRIAEGFKSAVSMGLVHSYADQFGRNGSNLAGAELAHLRQKGRRIDHPTSGSIKTKDIADCYMIATYHLLRDEVRREDVKIRASGIRAALGAKGGYGIRMRDSAYARERLREVRKARRPREQGR